MLAGESCLGDAEMKNPIVPREIKRHFPRRGYVRNVRAINDARPMTIPSRPS